MITKIGVDISGVLANDKLLHMKTRDHSIFTVMEDALDVVGKIVNRYGAENIFIISRVQTYQLAFIVGIWMETHQFLQKTKIPLDNVYICTQHKEKAKIAKELGITHMIDNCPQVLSYFPENTKLIAFQAEDDGLKKYSDIASRFVSVDSWKEVANYFDV